MKLFRSDFMTAVVQSDLAPQASTLLTKQQMADLDYEKYRHSEKILIFGGIDENN